MKPLEYLDRGITIATTHQAWFVPLGILALSHIVFAAGGVLAALVSGVMSAVALRYHERNINE